MHAYKTYSEYRVYKIMNVPVLRIQASSNQYFSTISCCDVNGLLSSGISPLVNNTGRFNSVE